MDANHLRFWLLAGGDTWAPLSDVGFDGETRRLTLLSTRADAAAVPPGSPAEALTRVHLVPGALDGYGSRATWDEAANAVLASGVLDDPVPVFVPPPGERPTDLAMGYEGIFYLALAGAVVMVDRRDRWHPVRLEQPGFEAWRLAPDPSGGSWVLDRTHGLLARVSGQPLTVRPLRLSGSDSVQPCEENPDPPRLEVLDDVALPGAETLVALACSPEGILALLTWVTGEEARVRLFDPARGAFADPFVLGGAAYPYSLAWLNAAQIAILQMNVPAEASVYDLANAGGRAAIPVEIGGYMPEAGELGVPEILAYGCDLRDPDPGAQPVLSRGRPLAVDNADDGVIVSSALADHLGRDIGDPVEVEISGGTAALDIVGITPLPLDQLWLAAPTLARIAGGEQRRIAPVGHYYPLREHNGRPFFKGVTLPPHYPVSGGSRPLHRLSLASYALYGVAANRFALDSGDPETIWHRLYLEAVIPETCGIKVYLCADDDPEAPAFDGWRWHEHRFGAMFARADAETPVGVWMPDASEIAEHPGLLDCERIPGRIGLFSVLVQRAGRRVRRLRGRYLHVRVELFGDSFSTPEIAALRVYGSRFSYVEHYLPELYRETVFGPDGDDPGASTPADFLERFLDNFEGILTLLEDKVAGAYLLTEPRTTCDDALAWLGSWIGLSFDPAYPSDRRRALLQAAPRLYRWRGTLYGLQWALDLATGGGVTGGEIVVLEDFKLRHAIATILGADLEDEHDPLLLGRVNSGNSYVGDTLFLGDENRREFLALFRADVEKTAAEQQAIQALFDRLAYRVTVLVHQDVQPQDLGLIRRVVELETPAHIASRVVTATYSFLVGIASLVGVDTYLRPEPPREPVRVGRSQIGVRDVLLRPASLDPRLAGSVAPPAVRPVAHLEDGHVIDFGEDFSLDASDSRAAPGREIDGYIWTLYDE